ncbi:uncharacterized protein SAPINGB_P006234 [Magnusiomyces paraingens]|uniref:F-box domain-containing protein n=1 Tax=Magnusiomyces paraingens TaxID=2606893 RepID=A0A5E8C930_9ASCO|nr:uncharacterized protein SAPINGB_P006234 [Saprochaete ingens]VVT58488.1 unnamed protein product [Saprochaete ingens]
MTEQTTTESIIDGVSRINIYSQDPFHILNIPVEVLNELSYYLPAKDIRALTQTCIKLKDIYDRLRWLNCVVNQDEGDNMMTKKYINIDSSGETQPFDRYDTYDYSFPNFDEVPARVFGNPRKYSWFPSEKIKTIVLSGKGHQHNLIFTKFYDTPFHFRLFPRVKSFDVFSRFGLKDSDILLDYNLFKMLREAVAFRGNDDSEPFWKLKLNGFSEFDSTFLLDFADFRISLRELSLNTDTIIDPAVIKDLDLPNLKKLFTKDLEFELYNEILQRLHHWPKLEHLTFFLMFQKTIDGTYSVTLAVHEILKLPTSLKTCDMILGTPKYPDDEFIPITRVMRIEAVTSIRDKCNLNHDTFCEDFEIIKYLELPRARKATQTLEVQPEYTNPFLAKDLGKTLTHLDLNVVTPPVNILSYFNNLVNLRVLILTIYSYPGFYNFSDELTSTMNTISQTIADGGKWSELELKKMFTSLLEKDQKNIFRDQEGEVLDISFDKALDVLMQLIIDPIGVANTGQQFDKQLNVMIFLEALLATMQTSLPSLEYFFLKIDEFPLPSPQFQKLLLVPPTNIKQVLISYDDYYDLPVLPELEYRVKIETDYYHFVIHDLAKKRVLPLMSQGTISPMSCFEDGFDGWF